MVKRLRRRPLKAKSGVRFPLELPEAATPLLSRSALLADGVFLYSILPDMVCREGKAAEAPRLPPGDRNRQTRAQPGRGAGDAGHTRKWLTFIRRLHIISTLHFAIVAELAYAHV